MIKIIVLLCSLSSPTNCREQTVTTSDFAEISTTSCLMGAPQLAEWMRQHPTERLAAWRCIFGKLDGRGQAITGGGVKQAKAREIWKATCRLGQAMRSDLALGLLDSLGLLVSSSGSANASTVYPFKPRTIRLHTRQQVIVAPGRDVIAHIRFVHSV